jgi:Ca2+/H+ antiporter, TMEM165/GDT1 family
MLTTVLVSLSVVFLAELGDKSQLMAMTYALRHRWWVVLSGVGIAAFLVQGLSVMIGHFLGLTLPERPIAFAAAIAFLLFAVWTWREGRAGDKDPGSPGRRTATRAARRRVLVHSGRARRQDDARHCRLGQ